MEFLSILIFTAIGILAGIFSGLLGIGGGIITVPSLLFAFYFLDYPAGYEIHMAIGTSLAAMIFTTSSAVWTHNANKAVRWDFFTKIIPGLFLGMIAGYLLEAKLSGHALEIYFGFFLCLMAVYFWFAKKPAQLRYTPNLLILFLCSLVIGLLAIIFGAGGGTLVMPLLLTCAISQKQAIGTSATTSFFIAVIGTILYWIMGRNVHSTGFVYLPAFFVIGLVSFFTASYGARLSNELPDKTVKQVFAVILMLTGAFLIF